MKSIALIVVFLAVLTSAIFAVAQDKPVVSMKKHQEAGLSCEDCHQTENPVKKPKKKHCLECHGNDEGVFEGQVVSVPNFPERKINPHDSHYGKNIRCTKCHAYHKKPKLACNDCHDYELEVK